MSDSHYANIFGKISINMAMSQVAWILWRIFPINVTLAQGCTELSKHSGVTSKF